jgi:hypothetical protein
MLVMQLVQQAQQQQQQQQQQQMIVVTVVLSDCAQAVAVAEQYIYTLSVFMCCPL